MRSCTARSLTANGLPDHATDGFPNADNPSTLSAQTIAASFTLTPTATRTTTTLGGPSGAVGYVPAGAKIDADTNSSCNDSGSSCSPAGLLGLALLAAANPTCWWRSAARSISLPTVRSWGCRCR